MILYDYDYVRGSNKIPHRKMEKPIVDSLTLQMQNSANKPLLCYQKTWLTVISKREIHGVYARGSKRSHTGGKCVTCRGLKEWWSLSLTHQFPARERRRAGLTTLLRSPVLDRKKVMKRGRYKGIFNTPPQKHNSFTYYCTFRTADR